MSTMPPLWKSFEDLMESMKNVRKADQEYLRLKRKEMDHGQNRPVSERPPLKGG